jgi:hypothetical protein
VKRVSGPKAMTNRTPVDGEDSPLGDNMDIS